MTDRRWLAGARAPRRALDALASLAAASSPLREGGHVLGELTGDPLQSLTAAAVLPQPLEAALARLEQPAGEAAHGPARSPRVPAQPGILGPKQPPGGWPPASETRTRVAARGAERPPAAVLAAADPEAVKRAVTRALAQVAPAMRDAVHPARSAVGPRVQGSSLPPPADATVRSLLPLGDGIAGFAARIAGGEAVTRQLLALEPVRGGEAATARVSGHRTDSPVVPGVPAVGFPEPPSAPAMRVPPRAAAPAAATPAAPPRNLAELVEHWSRRNPSAPAAATIAPSADLIPVAGTPANRGPVAAAAPPVGMVIARVADEPPRTGELIALDALTHAIERVLVAEVRRHGLVVEES